MALKLYSAKQYVAKKMKATIQLSGRLGFTNTTREELNLSEDSYIYIAQEENSNGLYLIVAKNKDDKAFKVHKSGSYFYIPTKRLFDELKYDYTKITYIFDLVREESMDDDDLGKVYKMNKREIKKKGGFLE